MALASWIDRTTPDGRWSYGVGEYEKDINEAVKLPGLAGRAANWLVGEAMPWFKAAFPTYASKTTITVYYIWAVDPNGQKRMGGEWTIATGGKVMRDWYFTTIFEPSMIPEMADFHRVAMIQASAEAPGYASIEKVVQALGNPPKPANSLPPPPPADKPGYVIPLLIAGAAVVLFIAFR